jgi:Ca2+-binding RTX toxin-like protein
MALVRVRLGALLVAGIVAVAAPVAAQDQRGGAGPDDLKGTAQADDLAGRGGADSLRGRGGNDRLRGGAGDDELVGAKGGDRVLGGGGADVLVGGRGRDTLNPGHGQDGVNMRDGVELASPGPEIIRARDGEPDQISCGAGNDKVFVDEVEDGVYDCETVIEP